MLDFVVLVVEVQLRILVDYVEIIDEAKLLGTHITSDLTWNKNTDELYLFITRS